MIFNSLEFAIFLPVVFLIYWLFLGRMRRAQNGFLLLASYVFYGWWDWRFLFLIFASSLVDYVVGICLPGSGRKKALLGFSLVMNLGMLGVFKYYNFFAESFAEAVTFFGQQPDVATLSWVLPVGISFYTFQTLSYSIDVYRAKIRPVHDPVAFFAYVSFFPQLVAGPIERASHLVPQFMVRDGEERLDNLLATHGYDLLDPTNLWAIDAATLAGDRALPMGVGYAMWPPLAMIRDIFEARMVPMTLEGLMAGMKSLTK